MHDNGLLTIRLAQHTRSGLVLQHGILLFFRSEIKVIGHKTELSNCSVGIYKMHFSRSSVSATRKKNLSQVVVFDPEQISRTFHGTAFTPSDTHKLASNDHKFFARSNNRFIRVQNSKSTFYFSKFPLNLFLRQSQMERVEFVHL